MIKLASISLVGGVALGVALLCLSAPAQAGDSTCTHSCAASTPGYVADCDPTMVNRPCYQPGGGGSPIHHLACKRCQHFVTTYRQPCTGTRVPASNMCCQDSQVSFECVKTACLTSGPAGGPYTYSCTSSTNNCGNPLVLPSSTCVGCTEENSKCPDGEPGGGDD